MALEALHTHTWQPGWDSGIRKGSLILTAGIFLGHDLNHKPYAVIRVVAINFSSRAAGPGMGKVTVEYMVSAGADILIGTETNIDTDVKAHYFLQSASPFTGRCGVADSFKSGALILWRANYGASDEAVYCGGRIVTVLLSIPGAHSLVRVIAIYGYTGGTVAFKHPDFLAKEAKMNSTVRELISKANSAGHTLVIGGDLNCIDDPALDAFRTNSVQREGSVLTTILGEGCVDTFRSLHPLRRDITRLNADGSGNRLDYILVGADENVLVTASAIHLTPGIKTDHRAVFADLLGLSPRQEEHSKVDAGGNL